VCDVKVVTHREMRNQSGEILRRVAGGESIQVIDHGQLAALIVPPVNDAPADLVSRGQVRVARRPAASLRAIVRCAREVGSTAIVDDVGRDW
jgi:antitoxin (DNA-binding transcriptional repressor) of toxin-antitoxin stability system